MKSIVLDGKYQEVYYNVVKFSTKKSQAIPVHFSMYTKHDIEHFKYVEHFAAIITETMDLNEEEKLCLALACYCHDLGMSESVRDESFKYLDRNAMRTSHARLSEQIVHRDLRDIIEDEDIRDVVGRLCRAHGENSFDSWEEDEYTYRFRLLAAVLQFADSIDLRNARKADLNIHTAKDLLEYPFLEDDATTRSKPDLRHLSRLHWLRHYYSTQPSVSWEKGSIPVLKIRFKARVGVEKWSSYSIDTKCGDVYLDKTLALIEEIITYDALDTWSRLRPVLEKFFRVEFAQSNITGLDYLKVDSDTSKLNFPKELVHTVLKAGMLFSRSIQVDAVGYKKRRIESYFYEGGVQLSYSSKAATLSRVGDSVERTDYDKSHVKALQAVATWHWDIVLLAYRHYAEKIATLFECKKEEAKDMIAHLCTVPNIIFEGKLLKMYIDYDDMPIPYTANEYVSKQAFFNSDDKLVGGSISINNSTNRQHFDVLRCNVAKRLGLGAKSVTVTSLRQCCDNENASRRTRNTFIKVFESLIIILEERGGHRESVDLVRSAIIKLQNDSIVFTPMQEEHEAGVMVIENSHFVYSWGGYDKFMQYWGDGRAVVLQLEGKVIGYYLLRAEDNGKCNIVKMVVDKSYQRRGIGTLVLDKIVDYAKSKCYPAIMLHVRETNTSAIELYLKYGFKHVQTCEGYYKKSTQEAALEMEYNYIVT